MPAAVGVARQHDTGLAVLAHRDEVSLSSAIPGRSSTTTRWTSVYSKPGLCEPSASRAERCSSSRSQPLSCAQATSSASSASRRAPTSVGVAPAREQAADEEQHAEQKKHSDDDQDEIHGLPPRASCPRLDDNLDVRSRKQWAAQRGAAHQINRRRPTLPGPCGPSTIGAEGLNFSVRNGKRYVPLAMTTEKLQRPGLSPDPQNCTAGRRERLSKNTVKPSEH